MSTYSNLNDKQIQLLSAHLDGELNEKERARVSALLATSPDAARMLDELRLVKAVLRLTPTRKVPHNYTLTRLEAQGARPGWVFNALRIVSGLSAAALAAVLAFDFLMPIHALPQAVMFERFADESMSEVESAGAPAEKGEPPIINSSPAPGGYGIGGGGGDGAVESEGQQGLIIPDIIIKPGQEMPGAAVPAEQIGDGAELEAPADAVEAEGDLAEEKRAPNTGPILGVRPPELQGETIIDKALPPQIQALSPQAPRMGTYRIIEITLFVVTLLTALAALILSRRKRLF